jgi:hypothetical protein
MTSHSSTTPWSSKTLPCRAAPATENVCSLQRALWELPGAVAALGVGVPAYTLGYPGPLVPPVPCRLLRE